MIHYNVTLKALVNVRVAAVPAPTSQEAIDVALTQLDLYALFQRDQPTPKVQFTEYGEEIPEALVDEVRDEEYERSCWFLWRDGQWVRAPDQLTEPAGTAGLVESDNAGCHVVLSVRGGVADMVFKPAGVATTVFDYDVDGDGAADKDPDGAPCRIVEWPAGEAVHENRHWPIVRKALDAADQPYTRRWQCPGCGRTTGCSYEDLAEIGSPFCTDCDREMTLL